MQFSLVILVHSHWAPFGAGLEDAYIGTVAVAPALPGRVFAATRSCVVMIDQSAHPAACLGDVNIDGAVTVDELLLAVDILLGQQPLSSDPGLDEDGSSAVEVSEVIGAVRNALLGC